MEPMCHRALGKLLHFLIISVLQVLEKNEWYHIYCIGFRRMQHFSPTLLTGSRENSKTALTKRIFSVCEHLQNCSLRKNTPPLENAAIKRKREEKRREEKRREEKRREEKRREEKRREQIKII
ncbi:regulator of nonsense transcripts 3A-like [Melospiza melodia melodia]|uniref:regulator of nonsense transcripts 3A-like n=1 Tax=Melospiza melodia melodia TaxID=1914991 RepID=UPI002FD7295F